MALSGVLPFETTVSELNPMALLGHPALWGPFPSCEIPCCLTYSGLKADPNILLPFLFSVLGHHWIYDNEALKVGWDLPAN